MHRINAVTYFIIQCAILLLLLVISATAQTTITGTVLEENGSTLPTANVLLLQPSDSSVVKGAVTDHSGFYELNNITADTYLLSVSMIGFRRYVSSAFEVSQNSLVVDAITLQVSLEQLDEVGVTARRPLFEQKIDRLVVNVQKFLNIKNNHIRI